MDALVIIDFQNYLRGYDPKEYADYLQSADDAINKTTEMIDEARAAGHDVIVVAYTKDPNLPLSNHEQAGIVPEILEKLTSNDAIFRKEKSSAIDGKEMKTEQSFHDHLKEKGYNNLFFAGSSIVDCVANTINDVLKDPTLGNAIIIRDCCDPNPALTTQKRMEDSGMDKVEKCSSDKLRTCWREGKPLSHTPFNRHAMGVEQPNQPTRSQEPAQQATTRPERKPSS